MKKVFVTGATGLLGTNTVIKLLEYGYFVIALVRQKSSWMGEKNENLRLVEGDLFSDISRHLQDVASVIHIAAETAQDLLDYEDYRKVNYDASVHLLSQADAAGVEKFLFVSTANTLGYGSTEAWGTENAPQRYPFTHSFYAKSKLETESYLLQQNRTTKIISVNPTFMIGAYDHKPSSGRIIFWTWNKKIVFYPKGGKNFVHVEDAAEGVIKAFEQGRHGEKYLLAHENLSYKTFFGKVNRTTKQNPIMVPIPDTVLAGLGLVGDFLRSLKIKTSLSSPNMKALRIHNYYSNRKSVEELGMKYQAVDRAVEDAVHFFKGKRNTDYQSD
ncbi:MAG: NAD-dependent epimerase/dehydratase family protein [Chryseobacterium sp.]|jgi:nucleoside-diphosphate-sugar epimerase|uniref:NAD-dependent epimerase/dehydratase family protein n=1 Tax=Chryseobacterium sp. TaxID=1871047 RepID=UPI00283357D1|nr:NAD-dependent epimerase/dehydratase family protein [Chryseobacterium sp.]MDR2236909.1 NAD-dependent epimerase/dehydratase family protein [Chryseobacterium sp.]